MFGYNDDDEASPNDVGKFLSQAELEAWWSEMQAKYPEVFLPSDLCPQQHPFGTKLMAYFDNDPNRPIRVEIVGSKFRNDCGKYAFYVVKYKDVGKLSFVHLTSAHDEEWKVGWDVPPPSS